MLINGIDVHETVRPGRAAWHWSSQIPALMQYEVEWIEVNDAFYYSTRTPPGGWGTQRLDPRRWIGDGTLEKARELVFSRLASFRHGRLAGEPHDGGSSLAGRIIIGGEREVHRLGFGAMRLTSPDIWNSPPDRDASVRLARRAVDLGIDFIDTADSYGLGASEEILREALHPYPEHLFIATKVGQVQPDPLVWTPLGRPAYLRQQCELSLRRLGVEQLDLLYLHRVDPEVPFADQVGELKRLREQGKIAHVGLSEVTVEQINDARKIVEIAAVQNRYSLLYRAGDAVVDFCAREDLAFVPWYPINNGSLPTSNNVVQEVCRDSGATAAQVALAWLLARSDAVLPIPGTSSISHLEENARATQVQLSSRQLAELDSLTDT